MRIEQKERDPAAPRRRGFDFAGMTSRGIQGAALIVALAVPLAGAAAKEPTVVTTTGTFTAVPSPSDPGANVFFGIRYAAPPEGALRWTPPQAPTPPAGTVIASTPGDACPQPQSTGRIGQSEDCLFLNVYVPASAHPDSNLPVFYWIHGGALVTGTGVQYDPSVMVANDDIIVVTINYRLGALGFLAEPGLAAASANAFENVGDIGNYGLMDQQFGMQWVQANIKGFGGDPSKVTIGGESAGGLSVTSHLASTTTAPGLFRGAIIESGGYMLHDVPTLKSYQASFGGGFDAALGCVQPSDAACLRSQTVAKILSAQDAVFGAFGIAPNSSTKILPLGLQAALASGQINRVPVLQGNNANEGRLFEPIDIPFAASVATVAAAGGPASYDLLNPNSFCAVTKGTPATCTYPQEINLFLAEQGIPAAVNSASFDEALAAEYPLANFPDPYLTNNTPSSDEALAQIFTDLVFACNILDSNTDLARWVPVFAYEFNDPNAPAGGTVIEAPNDQFGFPTASEHASELQFLFDFGSPLSADEQRLAIEMKTYWANFVTSGNPNVGTARFFDAPWFQFNFIHAVQGLVPGPAAPAPFFNFPTEHFCSTWEPFLEAE
jgi:para-nitrobenzyl esterase